MSASDVFLDTNILVHLTDGDEARSGAAEDVLVAGGVVSVQVLNEFVSVARRKLGLSWPQTREFLDIFRATLKIVPLTVETHELGLDLAERYGFNVYDAMIVAAASLAGCTSLFTEDMHDGLVIDKLTICNPFRQPQSGR